MDTASGCATKIKSGKVLGTNNPADLFTKYLDESTNMHHTENLGFKIVDGRLDDAPNLHTISISMDAYQTGVNVREWKWLQYLTGGKCGQTRREHVNCGKINLLETLQRGTGSRSQVLWGCNWPVQGSNGWNAAQLSQPWGSTLTFQCTPKRGAGAARVLSRGMTMHPRGRHSREGVILLIHGGAQQ